MSYFSSFFEKYFVKSVPCSFTYDGNPATFGEIQELGGDSARRCYARIMETERLRATLHVDVLHDSTAIEWWLDVTAPGEYDSDVIDNLRYCDLGIDLPFVDMSVGTRYPALHWAKGSRASETDFQPQHENLWPFNDDGYEFTCDSGRTSSGCMPYFNLQTTGTSGYLLAIGWTGQWYMRVHRKDTDFKISTIEFQARMDRARFRVYSGETLSLPRMMVMPWENVDLEGSFNQFRRLIAKDLPKKNGKPVVSPICLSTWGGYPAEYHKKEIAAIEKYGLGEDLYYWMDAGWFGAGDEVSENDYNDTWYFNVGEWNGLPKLYPNGLKEVGEAVEKSGMEFLLWFEMERSVSRHEIVKNHREYFIGAKLPFTMNDFYEGARTSYSMMLNLGDDAARRYITEVLAKHVEESKMRCLRIDSNHEPLFHWRYNDSEDRLGVTEIKYINGLYAMMDELRERYPFLVIDNCASGGRRLDYRMMRRSVPLFFTDYMCAPDRKDEALQVEHFAVARWLPVHGGSSSECSDYGYRSQLGTSIAFSIGKVEDFEQNSTWYKKSIAEAKRARTLLSKDLYLLTALSADLRDWFAYEAYDDALDKGMILAFRRENCADPAIRVSLKGLSEEGKYSFEDADSGEKTTYTAAELAEGFQIALPKKRSSAMIFFEHVQ